MGAVLEGPPVLVSVYRKLKQGVGAARIGQEATHVLVRVRGLGIRVTPALTLALTLTIAPDLRLKPSPSRKHNANPDPNRIRALLAQWRVG